MNVKQDRNFDDLIDRFETRIYDTVKGSWRLQLLQQDLHRFEQSPPLSVWDAGCGQGQISLWLARQGHHLTLCDLSSKMLDKAQDNFKQAGCDDLLSSVSTITGDSTGAVRSRPVPCRGGMAGRSDAITAGYCRKGTARWVPVAAVL